MENDPYQSFPQLLHTHLSAQKAKNLLFFDPFGRLFQGFTQFPQSFPQAVETTERGKAAVVKLLLSYRRLASDSVLTFVFRRFCNSVFSGVLAER